MQFGDPYFVLGIIGMLMILWAFLMNQMNKWRKEMLIYDASNSLGSLFLVLYALDGRAWPFVILNGVWLLYSAKDVLQGLKK